jgi:hypothetical protein
MPERQPRLEHPTWTHSVEPNITRHLQPSSLDKCFQTCVHDADWHDTGREMAARQECGERHRAPARENLCGNPRQVDLAKQFVEETNATILIGQVGKRTGPRSACGTDHGVNVPNRSKEVLDRGWLGEIDAELTLSMAGAHYLMPGNERVDNGFADRAGCPDD